MDINKFHFKKFKKNERSSFAYWYYHWKAFNLVALSLGAWKFKYLFHDIEKPWLRLFWPYEKVQAYHRTHSNHHVEYPAKKSSDYDWEAMVIDWECSPYTKVAAKWHAVDALPFEMDKLPQGAEFGQSLWLAKNITPVLYKFKLIKGE